MNILVLQNEKDSASLMGSAVKRLGHSPTKIQDHEKALRLLRNQRKHKFSAVIAEVGDELTTGIELAKTLHKEKTKDNTRPRKKKKKK